MQDEQDLVIPLVEERVSATKRTIETARVRVRTRIEQREELVRAELSADAVEIERVPIGREVAAVPAVRQEAGTTIVPVVEEVLVVEKKLMLVEEIRLTRTRTTAEFAQPVTLAAQRAEIERHESSGDTTNPHEE